VQKGKNDLTSLISKSVIFIVVFAAAAKLAMIIGAIAALLFAIKVISHR